MTCDIDDVAAFWDRVPCGSRRAPGNRYFVQPHIAAFANFPDWHGKRVLEIGCGIGEDTEQFVAAGADVVAMDVSRESVAFARQRVPKARVICWNAETPIPSPYFGFDLVYSFGVIHHTPHPERVLLMAHDVLADYGELRIMLYAEWSWKFLTGEQPETQAGCPVVRTYTKRSARSLVESCGFRVTSITKTHIFPYRVDDYVRGTYVRAWPWRGMTPRVFHAAERILGHHLLIKAVKA